MFRSDIIFRSFYRDKMLRILRWADIAQLVEHLTCNENVLRSIRGIGSKKNGGVPEWSKGSDCKSDGSAFGGSNPPPTTSVLCRRS